MKSSSCALRFAARFASDHVNSVSELYIRIVLASTKAPQAVYDKAKRRPACGASALSDVLCAPFAR